MGRKAPSEAAWRRPLVIVAAVLGTLGIGLAALKVFGAGSTNTCTLSDGNYRLAKFYNADGKMDMVVYSYMHADQTSEELMLAAKNGGNSPASLFHNFYKTEVCANQTRCSGVVLDIGASIGTHALYLAKLGYEVHAFEPQKNNTQLLRCSANAMGFRNLYVVQEGISDHIGTECLIEPTVTAMHLGIFAPRSLGNCSHFLPAAVDVVSLDHYWMNVLGKRQISFIKIDTEAHELYVLLGGTQLFAEMPPPMMLMEWYPKMLAIKNTTDIAVMQAIASAGYRVWDCQTKVEIDTTPVGVRVLSRYKESVTDLLLLHKSKYPLSQPLKTYSCGY